MSTDEELEETKAPLLEHLIELRNRLVYALIALFAAFVVCYVFAEQIFAFLVRPLSDAFHDQTGRRMIYTGLTETFFTYIKVAFFTALFLSFPIIANQIYKFVAPGLYKNERMAFLPYLIATPICFAIGAALVYYGVMPLALGFFLGMQQIDPTGVTIEMVTRVSEYLSLIMTLLLAFGVCFQLPVILTLLAQIGVIGEANLKSWRKYAIVVVIILAAFLTPPDPISQLGLALPLLLLYEFSIIAVRIVEKRRLAKEAELLKDIES
jgi:sec-independent protein translocase protein TatC